ncbi:MAG: flagellar basal body L-ring protein FlgH [Desulfobacterales bacterium]|nr:flagellar basal body L-ring protein FlgH [Desulfobacterales bacterium]
MTLSKNKILTSIKLFFILFFSFCAVIVSGCIFGSGQQGAGLAVPEGLSDKPAVLPQFAELRSNEGSLFSGQSRFYFEDTKACMVGDTVVVDIMEISSSSMKVSTESSRKTGINIGVSSMFGKLAKLAERYKIADTNKLLGTKYESNLEGEAESDRTGQVTASIAARVTEILPNGNLSLFGRRAIKANNETQYIVVSGVIRPGDISADNRVKSIALADSRIEYYGEGVLADKQRPGWGVRLFDNLWPF